MTARRAEHLSQTQARILEFIIRFKDERGYAPAMLNAWKSGGCYSQVSGFMGYRLQLDSATHDTQVARGGTLPMTVNLRNVGWARMFTDRSLVVQLRHRSTGAIITGGSLNVSATEIRAHVAHGTHADPKMHAWLPAAVQHYIEKHSLYR